MQATAALTAGNRPAKERPPLPLAPPPLLVAGLAAGILGVVGLNIGHPCRWRHRPCWWQGWPQGYWGSLC
ncbi:hypothetical protein B296_00058606 [Ensete ventricosum]|uniref:Uncharacterized protein n=1 Tax=Ensete ventricosum TaxID=4639 RepID=A0A426X097_ENSVE|nr:hypothetical protein B296_00058606 [Ensete ventricosum]